MTWASMLSSSEAGGVLSGEGRGGISSARAARWLLGPAHTRAHVPIVSLNRTLGLSRRAPRPLASRLACLRRRDRSLACKFSRVARLTYLSAFREREDVKLKSRVALRQGHKLARRRRDEPCRVRGARRHLRCRDSARLVRRRRGAHTHTGCSDARPNGCISRPVGSIAPQHISPRNIPPSPLSLSWIGRGLPPGAALLPPS